MKVWHCVGVFIAVVMVIIATYFIFTVDVEIVLDAKNRKALPINFRMVSDLKLIGSAQFSKEQLVEVLRKRFYKLFKYHTSWDLDLFSLL